ncbi:MAG TPA: PAS domain-containing protein, partial [Thermoanaerobaculia bacterium]|nr:PAS domain-containing protein [Thermoanaerobaculia bacterium]
MPIATDPPRASRLQLRLGTGVFAGAALLLALTIGLGVAYATWKANRVAEERLRRDLAAVPAIFGGYAASQADARRSQVRSLVEESGTKALLGEGGASAETAHDSAAGFARALGAGAVFLFDARGALISRSDRGVGEEAGRDFSDVSWVRDPLVELSPATAYILDVTRTRTLSLVASAPVTQGEKSEMKLNGVLAAAFPMTDERAREVALLAAGDAAFLANLAPRDVPPALEVVAASEGLKSAGLRAGLAEARDVFPRLFRDGQVYGPFDFALDGEVWVGTALPIKSGRGEPIAALLVARGKKAELAPFVGISRGIAAVGVAILLVFFPLSFLLAHRASRSIEQLAEAAAAIGEGRAPSLPRSRWKEVGALTRAFGSMVRELGVRDSERRRAEEVTAGWKNRYEAAIFASGQILYDWEPETNAVTFGGATERILGIAASRLTGGRAAWSERVHPEDREAFRAETERVLSEREPFHLEYRVRREDGAYVSVRDEGYFVRRAAGESERMVGFVVDVTQERRLEEHVRQSQRIEAVGRLAGGIAHDFNNLLTVIQGTTSLLLQRCEEADEELRQDLNEILRASERATAMTRQLLAFSRRQVVRVETADLNAVVAEMQKMLRRLIGENIELVTVAGGGALPVRVDLTQMEQVVMNLVVNARDAMPRGGRLTIETGAVEGGEGEA